MRIEIILSEAFDAYRGKGRFAPIMKLPPDVLRHIFRFGPELQRFIPLQKFHSFVRSVSQVCSEWRSIAISMPELWTNIFVPARCPTGQTKIINHSYLDLCILRSKSAPMDIYFIGWSARWRIKYGCMDTLIQSVPRWETLQVGLAFLEQLQELMPEPMIFNGLKTLTIMGYEKHRGIDFRCAPVLNDVRFWSVIHPTTTFSTFPWSQITRFSSQDLELHVDELLTILKYMPRLVSYTSSGYSNVSRNRYVTLLNLKHLKICGAVGCIEDLLTVIISPCLELLELKYERPIKIRTERSDGDKPRAQEDCGILIASAVRSFLQKSACCLETLVLKRIPLSNNWNSNELRRVKRLDIIDIWDNVKLSSDYLVWLKWPLTEEQPPLFPRLEILNIGMPSDVSMGDMHHLMDLLRTRLPLPSVTDDAISNGDGREACISSVTLCFRSIEERHRPVVERLRDFARNAKASQPEFTMAMFCETRRRN